MIRRPPRSPLVPSTPLSRSFAIRAGSPLTNSTRHVVHRALPPHACRMSTPASCSIAFTRRLPASTSTVRSEEHTSELQSRQYLVCRLLLEKKTQQLPLKFLL